jgi:hypothetical protein
MVASYRRTLAHWHKLPLDIVNLLGSCLAIVNETNMEIAVTAILTFIGHEFTDSEGDKRTLSLTVSVEN